MEIVDRHSTIFFDYEISIATILRPGGRGIGDSEVLCRCLGTDGELAFRSPGHSGMKR